MNKKKIRYKARNETQKSDIQISEFFLFILPGQKRDKMGIKDQRKN